MKKIILTIFSLVTLSMPAVAQTDSRPKDEVAYLFTYFTGNKVEEEAIRFGVSLDGYHYYALNNNNPVIDSKKISSTGGVRLSLIHI